MKSFFKYCLLAAFLLSIVSCSKEMSRENGHSTTGMGDFYATIDGVLWNADSIQSVGTDFNATVITGVSITGGQVSIVLPGFKTGTYTLNATSSAYAFYVNQQKDLGAGYISNTTNAGGTVTITSIDTVNHLISGNFELTLIDPYTSKVVSITNGVIAYVPYTVESGSGPPTNGLSDTLNAVVDGNDFKSAQVLTSLVSGSLNIAGISSNGTQSVVLIMPPAISPGSYNMDFASGLYIGAYYPNIANANDPLVSANNGTLTITSNDTVKKRIKGSFSFIASSTITTQTSTIVSGYFSLNY